ncbi:MAG: hypothetical protein ACR2N7_11530, partial [Acidimicrobiia bacterium]
YGSLATVTAKEWIETGFGFAEMSILTVKEFQLGDKNVAERARATVDTVQDKIDVDQIQDQVSKMRHQMENVMSTWKDSFRPSTSDTTVKAAPAKKATATKTTVKTAPAKKAPAKKATATKTTTKKAPAKKTTAKKETAPKTTAKKTTAKKTASK